MAQQVRAPASEATQASNPPLTAPINLEAVKAVLKDPDRILTDPEQDEPDAPWDVRRQLRLNKTNANSGGQAWTGPWRTVPPAFAPDKYRLLDEKPFDASSDPLELLTEPSLTRTTLCGTFH